MKNKKEKLNKEKIMEAKNSKKISEKKDVKDKDVKDKEKKKKEVKKEVKKDKEKEVKKDKVKEIKKDKGKSKNSLQKQKLCKVVKSDSLQKQLEEYKKLVSKPNYVCDKCGRVAQNKESLCHPVLLEKK